MRPALTATEAARLLGCSRSSIYRLLRAKENGDSDAWPTRVLRHGSLVRIPTAEFAEHLGMTIDELSVIASDLGVAS